MHAHEPGDPPRERLRLPRPGASNDAQRRVARRAHRDALILVQATEHLRVTCVICPCRHLILAGLPGPTQRLVRRDGCAPAKNAKIRLKNSQNCFTRCWRQTGLAAPRQLARSSRVLFTERRVSLLAPERDSRRRRSPMRTRPTCPRRPAGAAVSEAPSVTMQVCTVRTSPLFKHAKYIQSSCSANPGVWLHEKLLIGQRVPQLCLHDRLASFTHRTD